MTLWPAALALAATLAALPAVAAEQRRHVLPGIPDDPGDAALELVVTEQAPATGDRSHPVLYVHGATFPAALSVFYRFDGRSWADALNEAGFAVFGLDFAGYGLSQRWPAMDAAAPPPGAPLGRADSAETQVARAVERIRTETGAERVAIVAHSWGTIPAARFAASNPARVSRLVLFGAILPRDGTAAAPALGPWRFLTAEEQHRRFVEDVPRGEAPVLDERHFAAWAPAWLATDPTAATRSPPSVRTANGPIADILATWNGARPWDPARITVPVLNVRGAWDSLSTDADAARRG